MIDDTQNSEDGVTVKSDFTLEGSELGSREWFAVYELATFRIPGYPTSPRAMYSRLDDEKWESRQAPGRGPGGRRVEYRPPQQILDWIRTGMPPIKYRGTGRPTKAEEPPAKAYREVADDFVLVPYYDVRASAGHGAFIAGHPAVRHYAFDRQWMAQQIGISAHRLALIPVSGSSMEPDLYDGDLVLIDRGDVQVLREGVYVFEVDDGLFVKRLSLRGDKLVIESSNNQSYPAKELSLMRENPTFRLHGRVIGSPTFKRF